MVDDLAAPPTAVERFFFTPLYYPRGPLQVIGWWERRRLAFNLSVGAVGVLSLASALFVSPGPDSAMRDFGFVGAAIVYGLAANVCYTFGWMADLTLRRWLGTRAADVAPVMLRYGFVFSLGLTALPIPISFFARLMVTLFGAS